MTMLITMSVTFWRVSYRFWFEVYPNGPTYCGPGCPEVKRLQTHLCVAAQFQLVLEVLFDESMIGSPKECGRRRNVSHQTPRSL